MGVPLRQVDAFTREAFSGNPAGVCMLGEPRPDAWMQHVAAEMNLSETAFLVPEGDGFRLRWFTPTVEVELCGHATLASAHVLWEDGELAPRQEARFHTQSGLLTARQAGELIELDFPAKPTEATPVPAGLAEALGVEPLECARSHFDLLALFAAEEDVRRLAPDFAALKRLPVRGLIVTAPADDASYDFVSRFFAPAVGVDEDPVTGSAHCALAPFWAARLGKEAMVGYQASPRGGVVRVRVAGDRVRLGGTAVTVFRGELLA